MILEVNIMNTIMGLVGRVPTILWIIIGVTIVIPLVIRAVKKASKLLGVIALIVAALFMFPSIGSVILDDIGLTWYSEKNALINKKGVEITWEDIKNNGKEVGTLIKGKATDVLNKIDEENGYTTEEKDAETSEDENINIDEKEDTSVKVSVVDEEIKITSKMVKAAKKLGIDDFKKNEIILKIGEDYFIERNGQREEVSEAQLKALGIK